MNVESLKAFGTWLSNHAFWVLDGLFSASASKRGMENRLTLFDDHTYHAESSGTGFYGSLGEALGAGATTRVGGGDGPGFYV